MYPILSIATVDQQAEWRQVNRHDGEEDGMFELLQGWRFL
jgi:hypothetical protein